MKISLFDYDLPKDRIAFAPAEPRDRAKLLHVGATLCDRVVLDLPKLLNPGDVIVFNDSKVIPARLFATVDNKPVEILLHRPRADGWECFAKPAKKLSPGMTLHFAPEFEATVQGRTPDGQVILRFGCSQSELFAKLRMHGHVPLPPYIAREDTAEDATRYQTIYARAEGSVAAPTAGLHVTDALMRALHARGVQTAYVTLHVGAGTFQPVKVENTEDHVMHREWAEISPRAADAINAARAAGGKVVAVGTTSLRILETVADASGKLQPFSGETDIFITPGYRFKIVDRLMTNFHLPKSTLFMLVCAFAGLERMHAAYQHAIANDYRFYSYGDASLLEHAR